MTMRTATIANAGTAVMRLLGPTWRLSIANKELRERARTHTGKVVFALWHAQLLALLYAHRHLGVRVLISEHQDGEMIARIAQRFGYGWLKGSSTRGSVQGLKALVRSVNDGFDTAVTVDGPVGPALVVKPGVVEVARLTGAPVLPVVACARPRKRFSSWDAFELPAPFARVRVLYGEPILVPRDIDDAGIEQYREMVQKEMMATVNSNDEFLDA